MADKVSVVRAGDLSSDTAQTSGMSRKMAIGAGTGSRSIWAGRVTMEPGTRSGAHHHGDCESVIFLVSGHATIRYGDGLENSVDALAGDFIHIPADLVHQEINASDAEIVDCVVIREPNENVVVNVDLPGA